MPEKWSGFRIIHYSVLIMSAMGSQITRVSIVYSTVYSCADKIKQQCSAPLAFVQGIHRWPVNSPRKWPVTTTWWLHHTMWSDVFTIRLANGSAAFIWGLVKKLAATSDRSSTGNNLAKEFSITIQIRWKLGFIVFQILFITSQQTCCICHANNFVTCKIWL